MSAKKVPANKNAKKASGAKAARKNPKKAPAKKAVAKRPVAKSSIESRNPSTSKAKRKSSEEHVITPKEKLQKIVPIPGKLTQLFDEYGSMLKEHGMKLAKEHGPEFARKVLLSGLQELARRNPKWKTPISILRNSLIP